MIFAGWLVFWSTQIFLNFSRCPASIFTCKNARGLSRTFRPAPARRPPCFVSSFSFMFYLYPREGPGVKIKQAPGRVLRGRGCVYSLNRRRGPRGPRGPRFELPRIALANSLRQGARLGPLLCNRCRGNNQSIHHARFLELCQILRP